MQMEARTAYEDIIRRTIEEIEGRLDDPPGFRELADKAFLSPYHFHRIFRAMVGESPAELIRRLRLERAATQLYRTKTPITEIAFDAGYATHEAFTKAFQSEFGMAPSIYRAEQHEHNGIQTRCSVHYVNGVFTRFHPIDRGGRNMKLDVVDFPKTRVAAVRHIGAFHEIGKAFGQLGQVAGPMGLFAQPNAYGVAVFLDDPEVVPQNELNSLAGVFVAEGTPIGDLEETHIGTGRYLKAEFTGHYSGLSEAWGTVYGKCIPEGGYKPREGTCFEVYLNDCNNTPPDELRTDIYVPIA